MKGINGFIFPNKVKKKTSSEIDTNVNLSIENGNIFINLQTYVIPSTDYSGTSGTVTLPYSGEWLLIGNAKIDGNMFTINSQTVITTSAMGSVLGFAKYITGSSFTFTKTGTIEYIYAVRVRH